MKFETRVWKQGNSKIITIPSSMAKYINIKDKVMVEISVCKTVVCKCGHLYGVNGKADHKCEYFEFNSENSAMLAAYSISKVWRLKNGIHKYVPKPRT